MDEVTKNEIKGRLKEYVESITRKSRGKNKYNCPLCGSGTGRNHSAAFNIDPRDPTSWRCFACGKGGDIFDLIGEYEHITDYNEQLKRAAEFFGVQNRPKIEQYARDRRPAVEEEAADYSHFFLQAKKDLSKTDYPQRRGISAATLDRFNVGFVEAWRPPKVPTAPATPRLIIPTSQESYLARDTRPADQIPEAQRPFTKSKAGRVHFFNIDALQAAQTPVFIVEGEIDALSIIEAGAEAVALGSAAYINRFIEYLKEHRPAQPLIVAMDNDEAGRKAAEKLNTGLEALKINAEALTLPEGIKDPNEALMSDREGFRRAVAGAIARARAKQEETERARRSEEEDRREEERGATEEYLGTAAKYYIRAFRDGIAASADTPAIPTGFYELDKVLDGGLYEGLYSIGGISSVGKTSFVMQMADQIAQQRADLISQGDAQGGRDVLIFSLEMARFELMAKSISRHTFMRARAMCGGDIDAAERKAKGTRDITAGYRYKNYSQEEKDLINAAGLDYDQYAAQIYISEGVGDIGVKEIIETVQKHIRYTGKAPVVIIDYMQILAPNDIRATDKQNTDKAVLELKRLSRKHKIPVLAISSFNRENYKDGANMKAFKESGAIEYSSDVLIGLQFRDVGKEGFDEEREREKSVRQIILKVMKNRNGTGSAKIGYTFYAKCNYFEKTAGNLADYPL